MKENPMILNTIQYFYNRDEHLPLLKIIGWERRTNPQAYDWDCRNRGNEHCLFQYTVSGEGEIELEGTRHRLKAGQAFLIEVPGPYRYWLPKDSSHWEFKFLDLTLDALPLWKSIVKKSGHIIELGSDNPILKQWDNTYRMAELAEIDDLYDNSLYAYRFLMELRRWTDSKPSATKMPDPVQRCLDYIDSHASELIGLEEMAEVAGISKYYLHRLFRDNVGETPINYLTRKRVEIAAQLLVETNFPVKEVAQRSGFAYGNYFARVFRKWMQTSPDQFRKKSTDTRTWRIHID
ncbi:MAG TPA: AraC family transcriptional regulator [Bacillales bacterium]|nr:AraC family transcriptional regulator [Bacillales bacterium]